MTALDTPDPSDRPGTRGKRWQRQKAAWAEVWRERNREAWGPRLQRYEGRGPAHHRAAEDPAWPAFIERYFQSRGQGPKPSVPRKHTRAMNLPFRSTVAKGGLNFRGVFRTWT